MVDVTHDDEDETEPFDLDIRVPGVAFDIGQPGFPRVLVVQRLADTVSEYDDQRPDSKGQAEYLKNALVRTRPSDTVYQVVYLPDGPLGGGELNDPSTRYPVPQSRLVPLRAERAAPIDDSPTWTPREAVQRDLLERLFYQAHRDDHVSVDGLATACDHAGLNPEVYHEAREAAEADAVEYEQTDTMSVDDGDGPDMELIEDESDDTADESDDGIGDFKPDDL